MTLRQRIQESAAELGGLLRQAEKQHHRFLKRRDARMQVSATWTPEGHPLVFIVRDNGIDVTVSSHDLTTIVQKAQAAQLDKFKAESERAGRLIPQADQNTTQKELEEIFLSALGIGKKTAALAHARHGALTKQINSVVEQIDSKLNAVLEIHGTEAIFQNPASKIVFYVEISWIGDKLGNQVKYVIKAD